MAIGIIIAAAIVVVYTIITGFRIQALDRYFKRNIREPWAKAIIAHDFDASARYAAEADAFIRNFTKLVWQVWRRLP